VCACVRVCVAGVGLGAERSKGPLPTRQRRPPLIREAWSPSPRDQCTHAPILQKRSQRAAEPGPPLSHQPDRRYQELEESAQLGVRERSARPHQHEPDGPAPSRNCERTLTSVMGDANAATLTPPTQPQQALLRSAVPYTRRIISSEHHLPAWRPAKPPTWPSSNRSHSSRNSPLCSAATTVTATGA
jgi:hypothetical protein